MQDCAVMGPPPVATQSCVAAGTADGLSCGSLGDWFAGQTVSASVSSYPFMFPVNYTYQLFATLQAVSQAGGGASCFYCSWFG